MSITDSAGEQNANSGNSGQANSPDNSQSEVLSTLTEQLKNLESQVNSLRSDKDKGVAKTNQRLSEFEKRQEELATMQAYLKEYGTPERAAREMAIDAMLQAPAEQGQKQTSQSAQSVAAEGTNQTQEDNLVALLNVNPNDPQFVKLLGQGLTPNDAAIQLASQRQQKQSQQATDNQAVGYSGASGAGAGSAGTQQTALETEYKQRLSAIRQGDVDAIGRLKDEMRGKGYEVY